MPALPPSSDFTGSGITEGQFKTAITNQRDFLAGLLGTTGNKIDALAALGVLGSVTVAKTAAYTVAAADRGKAILCSGTFSLSLTAASTLGNGFNFAVINHGAGTITIDPNSAEQIDGASTIEIPAGSSAVIVCTGTAFYSMGGGGNATGALIGYQVFTASGPYSKSTNNPSFVIVEVVAGGGGGGGYSNGGGIPNGGSGGATSFGTHCTATGGAGGGGVATATGSGGGGSGGVGANGDLNLKGSGGGAGSGATNGIHGGTGGDSYFPGGGKGGVSLTNGEAGGSNTGGGGSGAQNAGGGGGGGYSRKKIFATALASSETVTIGAGGVGGNGANYDGGSGGSGICIVWEYK